MDSNLNEIMAEIIKAHYPTVTEEINNEGYSYTLANLIKSVFEIDDRIKELKNA